MKPPKAPKVIQIKVPSAETLSNLSIPMSIIAAGLIISISLFTAGNTIKGELQNLKVASTGTTGTTPTTTAAAPATTVSLDKVKNIFDSGKYMKFGDSSKKNLLVEFSDPSCPYCHAAAGKDGELNKQMGTQFTLVADGGTYVAPVTEMKKLVDSGQAAFAYVYTTGHGNGKLGAQALYCAYDQNKFWDVHDLLMSNAGYNLLNNTVKNDVANAGQLADFLAPAIDKDYMLNCLQSKKYEQRVSDEDSFAQSLGIQGTPGFFVNENVVDGAVPYSSIQPDLKS